MREMGYNILVGKFQRGYLEELVTDVRIMAMSI
jgi:hypothetical protein